MELIFLIIAVLWFLMLLVGIFGGRRSKRKNTQDIVKAIERLEKKLDKG